MNESGYFAAVNGRNGFKSFFEEIFFGKEIKRRYIIKGGPGTGKSSFMRRIALHAERFGRGVEYFYCSSDTGSLDGIIIDSQTAIIDGTAPHSYDTVLPGAVDEIIYLGEFWNASELAKRSEELISLGESKRNAYLAAYGYLRAAGQTLDTANGSILSCVNTEKMKNAVQRIFSKLEVPRSGDGKIRPRQIRAFGVTGEKRLDTLEKKAKAIYRIEDYYGTSYLFFEELLKIAERSGANADVSYDTLDVSHVEQMYFSDTGDLFICSDTPRTEESLIKMKRFVDSEKLSAVRYFYRASMQVKEQLTGLAAAQLSLAGQLHGEIEKIYVANMDFERLSTYCEEFLKKII